MVVQVRQMMYTVVLVGERLGGRTDRGLGVRWLRRGRRSLSRAAQ